MAPKIDKPPTEKNHFGKKDTDKYSIWPTFHPKKRRKIREILDAIFIFGMILSALFGCALAGKEFKPEVKRSKGEVKNVWAFFRSFFFGNFGTFSICFPKYTVCFQMLVSF